MANIVQPLEREAWLEIDLDALVRNLHKLKQHYLPAHYQVLAVVKADAYGHGAIKIVKTLLQQGIQHFGVATFEEGLELRAINSECEILVLGALPLTALPAAIEANLSITVFNREQVLRCVQIAKNSQHRPRLHIKIDTGMHRLGVSPEAAVTFIRWVQSYHELELRGLFTHLACAEHEACSRRQIQLWEDIIGQLAPDNLPPLLHLANSAGAGYYHDRYSNMCRLGLALYGIYPDMPSSCLNPVPLEPLITLRSKIVDLHTLSIHEGIGYGYRYHTKRPSVIATIPLGYADGVPRALSNQLMVKVHGQLVPQVGSIAMDQMMIDVTDCACSVGDTVILLDSDLTVEIWAHLINTIPYELLCALRTRLPKIYHLHQSFSGVG